MLLNLGDGHLFDRGLDPQQMEVVFEGDTALEVIADGEWSVSLCGLCTPRPDRLRRPALGPAPRRY